MTLPPTLLTSSGSRVVDIGGRSLPYELRRSARKTLGITIEVNGEVSVTAPVQASIRGIERTLRRRRKWINRRVREAILRPPVSPPREWVNGETHRYLGRQYRLKIVTGRRPGVKLTGRFLRVTVGKRDDREAVQKEVERWYRERAMATFDRRAAQLVKRSSSLRIATIPPISVRRLRRRWGSYAAKGKIVMNVDAVKLPVGCIDYILMHEMCHVRFQHHGRAFWRCLDLAMPDWGRWRKRLEGAEI